MDNREFAVKYKKVELCGDLYLLIPQGIVEGYLMGGTFYSTEVINLLSLDNIKKCDYVVDNVVKMDDILFLYDYAELDEDFLLEYYAAEENEKFYFISTKDGKLLKREVSMSQINDETLLQNFEMMHDDPCIVLDNNSLTRLLSVDNLEEIKSRLNIIKMQLKSFKEKHDTYGTTRILVKNGHIVGMEDDGSVNILPNNAVTFDSACKDEMVSSDFSKSGLLSFLKQRVFGHDKELEIIATTLSRNLKPQAIRDDIESILVIGPTGVGKTLTFELVSQYFNVPFRKINTPELVPEGIVGKSLSDYIASLVNECQGDVSKAQRSIMFFDELDKIGNNGLDVKKSVIDELYKFMEGSIISLKKGNSSSSISFQNFDTGMCNLVYSGVFDYAYNTSNVIGFGTLQSREIKFDLQRLYDNSNFNKELLDRIQHKLIYQELSRNDKRNAMLSKFGILYKKKDMLKRLYGVDFEIDDDFVEAFLDYLGSEGKSMRDLNNLISSILMEAENVISSDEGKYHRLVLTRESVSNPESFKLF